jgi:hypothetical protein
MVPKILLSICAVIAIAFAIPIPAQAQCVSCTIGPGGCECYDKAFSGYKSCACPYPNVCQLSGRGRCSLGHCDHSVISDRKWTIHFKNEMWFAESNDGIRQQGKGNRPYLVEVPAKSTVAKSTDPLVDYLLLPITGK